MASVHALPRTRPLIHHEAPDMAAKNVDIVDSEDSIMEAPSRSANLQNPVGAVVAAVSVGIGGPAVGHICVLLCMVAGGVWFAYNRLRRVKAKIIRQWDFNGTSMGLQSHLDGTSMGNHGI